jgi:rhamnosyl/mannosyltransferase
MKVLHFYKTYYPCSFGGVEQVIFQLASGSAQLGVDSTVLSLTRQKVDRLVEVNGHQSYRCRSNFQIASTDFSLSSFWQFNELYTIMYESVVVMHPVTRTSSARRRGGGRP